MPVDDGSGIESVSRGIGRIYVAPTGTGVLLLSLAPRVSHYCAVNPGKAGSGARPNPAPAPAPTNNYAYAPGGTFTAPQVRVLGMF